MTLPTIKQSAWFALCENVLQTVISLQNSTEKETGVGNVIKIRMNKTLGQSNTGNNSVRIRKIPSISAEATDFAHLVDRNDPHESHLTCSLTINKIKSLRLQQMP